MRIEATTWCGLRGCVRAERCRALACMAAIALVVGALACDSARAEDVSEPAILQLFEAKWTTIENRMADVFDAGYGRLWVPPPTRASGGLSVGYDVFDRFDLGKPQNETLYGTELSFKTHNQAAHRAGVKVDADLIWNHNAFSNRNTPNFTAQGGYPGFAVTLPGDVNGDFHDPSISYQTNEQTGSLFGLIDIAQEKNHQFIRSPVTVGDPNNIPAGTIYNKPDPNNARFYTDVDMGGVSLTDPTLGITTIRYQFNDASPLAGDARLENATGLLMRSTQWLIEEAGVDGLRIDAAKHFPTWVMNYIDNAVFRSNPRLNLDGSYAPVYSYSEVADGDKGRLQTYIKQNLPSDYAIAQANTTVGGNRDALDFPLFYALRSNLSGNGTANNWHGIRNASQDTQDDGQRNGSQGVSFIDSHDDQQGFFPYLKNVAYAYTLMRPGQAVVYFNAKQFGENRDFPNDGKDDALGGLYGDTITTLVNLRNTHGRGNFHERWLDDAFNPNGFSNIYVYERSKSAVVGLNSRLDAGFDERTPIQTNFAAGTVLVELTGNAEDAAVDPGGNIPSTIRVNGSGQVTMRIPRNSTHGLGYVIYGVAPPQGSMSLAGVSSTLAGGTPTAATNGTTRLTSIDVITGNSFAVNLATNPVTLPAPFGEASAVRDVHADADTAMLKIDEGLNLNGNAGIDNVTPGSVGYGFEDFVTTRTPGYIWNGAANIGTGTGTYAQTIDATTLSEGRHYVTVRAFRHRDAATGGDGGPAVFTDFKKTIYVDRIAPVSQTISFDPFASNPSNLANRDLIVRSVDATADRMRFFLDVGAAVTDAQLLTMVQNGQGANANFYDRDSFYYGFTNVPTGNQRLTIVTLEPTGNYTIRRETAVFKQGAAAGFGDTNGNGSYQSTDIFGPSATSFDTVLFSQNVKFNAGADLNADALVDNRDLLLLGPELAARNANVATMTGLDLLLMKRADLNQDSQVNGADVAALYAAFGQTNNWTMDLNVDGTVGIADVATLVDDLVRTSRGDFNLDRIVDGADLVVLQRGLGQGSSRFDFGDATLDGTIDGADLGAFATSFGATGPIPFAAAVGGAVPEPAGAMLGALALAAMGGWGRRREGEILE